MPRDEDTPPDPLPAHRAVPVDGVFLAEMRRELFAEIRELRRERASADREVQQHLSGIEGQLREGNSTMTKHDRQIQEMAGELAEQGRDIAAIRAAQPTNAVARLDALTADLEERKLEKQRAKESLQRQVIAAVVCAAAVGAVGSMFTVLWWIVVTYVQAGHPGTP